jgi:hypothetical protein
MVGIARLGRLADTTRDVSSSPYTPDPQQRGAHHSEDAEGEDLGRAAYRPDTHVGVAA